MPRGGVGLDGGGADDEGLGACLDAVSDMGGWPGADQATFCDNGHSGRLDYIQIFFEGGRLRDGAGPRISPSRDGTLPSGGYNAEFYN